MKYRSFLNYCLYFNLPSCILIFTNFWCVCNHQLLKKYTLEIFSWFAPHFDAAVAAIIRVESSFRQLELRLKHQLQMLEQNFTMLWLMLLQHQFFIHTNTTFSTMYFFKKQRLQTFKVQCQLPVTDVALNLLNLELHFRTRVIVTSYLDSIK